MKQVIFVFAVVAALTSCTFVEKHRVVLKNGAVVTAENSGNYKIKRGQKVELIRQPLSRINSEWEITNSGQLRDTVIGRFVKIGNDSSYVVTEIRSGVVLAK